MPIKGKDINVTVPTFPAQFAIRPKMIHQHKWEVEYFKSDKGKKNKMIPPRGKRQVVKTQAHLEQEQSDQGKVKPQAEPKD